MQATPQDNQLVSKHRVLSFKPQVRLEWRGQNGQSETEQPDHSASLGDSIASSTRIRFSVHTADQTVAATPVRIQGHGNPNKDSYVGINPLGTVRSNSLVSPAPRNLQPGRYE
jgi:hypothetical protein